MDARIPLRLISPQDLSALRSDQEVALLLEAPRAHPVPSGMVTLAEFMPAPTGHLAECGCCKGRGAVSEALDHLFQARIRGRSPWFKQVLGVTHSGLAREAITTALANDPLTRSRFRLA
ncbi:MULTISPECIES: hypothetical protein [Roseomonadaceae]|uniref:Uncharacterized protein n=1 Tax=Falsiroseomonas oleicola TaxID=2801474 RepID=A0ABS6H0W7_9PROT|nr:hypothetical protein [Roseomonas oleicola]MBU8542315.1 hypothetical protein [Roseomonas oleicola]